MTPLQISKLIPGGQALATEPSGKKIFLWNALPGETVAKYEITKSKSHYAEAIAMAISNPSPHRTEPKDVCYLATSPWQIMDYDYELTAKQALIVEIFREHHISIPTPEIITDHHPYNYRNKMEYALYWDNDANRISLAFHSRGSHRKLPISDSSIERPEIISRAREIVTNLNNNHEPARKYQSLMLRASQSGQVSGGLYENGKPHPVFPTLTDTILDHTYSYSPNGFFQINLSVYEMALQEIKSHITMSKVLDLYAGVGTIGLSVARDKDLTLVEIDKSAYEELEHNATGTGATTICAKSEDALDFITKDGVVILDPPRAGCDPRLVNRLLEVAPPQIIYLSCNPATQARDVSALLTKYHISQVTTYNFFPRTPHIENLIVLSL